MASPATADAILSSLPFSECFFADQGLSFPADVGRRTTGDLVRDGVTDMFSVPWSTLSVCVFLGLDQGLSFPRNRAGFGDADRGKGTGLSDVFSNILTRLRTELFAAIVTVDATELSYRCGTSCFRTRM